MKNMLFDCLSHLFPGGSHLPKKENAQKTEVLSRKWTGKDGHAESEPNADMMPCRMVRWRCFRREETRSHCDAYNRKFRHARSSISRNQCPNFDGQRISALAESDSRRALSHFGIRRRASRI